MVQGFIISKVAISIMVMLAFLSPSSAIPLGLGFGRLSKRAASTGLRNDAIEGPCKNVVLIHARGTTEVANMGAAVGVPFATALESLMPENIGIQGVNDYPASVIEYAEGGSKTGAAFMAQTAADIMQRCPETKLVLSGYSQGGQVVHLAADMMAPEVAKKVAAVVVFGDGLGQNAPVTGVPADKVLQVCHTADLICQLPMSGVITPFHLTYILDVDTAAKFVMEKIGN
ncbi:hypothetical protein SeMB42_g03774 [Synchytrium endobioticum]|uniref:Cutinase n=1 Tax=Synchytrium endobioticum TaxID=286115 RepID=A0A507D4L9_9FUNG|nr:hypothetical protein SeLEV6574_g03627 [Synchytrium endobioticum]TPX46271.1 hypothetical protein SeMB42_g03774 [Synchytrium endobioticum]